MRGKTKIFELSCLCTYKDKVIREKLIFLNFPTTPAFDLSPYFGVDAIAILPYTNFLGYHVYSTFFIASIALYLILLPPCYGPNCLLIFCPNFPKLSKLSKGVQIVQSCPYCPMFWIVQSCPNSPILSKVTHITRANGFQLSILFSLKIIENCGLITGLRKSHPFRTSVTFKPSADSWNAWLYPKTYLPMIHPKNSTNCTLYLPVFGPSDQVCTTMVQ